MRRLDESYDFKYQCVWVNFITYMDYVFWTVPRINPDIETDEVINGVTEFAEFVDRICPIEITFVPTVTIQNRPTTKFSEIIQ